MRPAQIWTTFLVVFYTNYYSITANYDYDGDSTYYSSDSYDFAAQSVGDSYNYDDGDYDVASYVVEEEPAAEAEQPSSGCGTSAVLPNIYQRIVGGQPCRPHSWPWQVSVQRRSSLTQWISYFHSCGGALINNYWVITAAHCVYGLGGPEQFSIVLGEHNRSEPASTSRRIAVGVESMIIHPNYTGLDIRSGYFWRNDLALMKLNQYVEFGPDIQPICLPQDDGTDDIVNCWTTGWGRPITYGQTTDILMQVQMDYYDYETCSNPDWYGTMITRDMLGFGHEEGGRGTCQGDSGGPVVCLGKQMNYWTLRGLISWAKGECASPKHPTICTFVGRYIDWIRETLDAYSYDYY